MENPLRKQIRSIMKDHKKRQMWYRIVTTLAVVVVFVTTYMLILPAITMENKAECGITEHKHDANCYSSHYEKEKELACTTDSLGVHKHTDACYDAEHKLICGYADFVIHEHDASCYDKDGNLVCTIPEHKLHQHTPECYQMQKQLVCTQEESVGHTHTPECYTKQQGELICVKEEHTHGEGCYDAEGNLICTLEEHTHSDECYEWTDVLTCTIPESAGHTHSEACYQDVQVLICEEPAELHTHTAECYKDGVLACGKLELKEHKHSETCFTEKQHLVETLICDRVEHVHTDECYKKSTEETATSEAVTASQNEETSSEETSSEADTDAEEPSTEASSEETSLEEASTEETSIEETSLEASSEDESEAESETETAEEAESESEVESESESETEESSSIEAETEEESSEEVSTEEESLEEESFEETSTEETSEEELTSEEASTEEETSEAEEESSELPQLTGIWPQDMIAVASALVGSENTDLVEFCLNYVGVYGVSFNTDLDAWIESLQENDLYGAVDEFDPNPGDVAFFDEDGDGRADYVGVVVDATFDEDGVVTEFTVVETNDQGIVEEHVYSAGEESLMGCCLMPYIADSNDALVIPETTTYTDFKKYVTSMAGTGTVYDKTTGNYKSDLKVNFSIPSNDIKNANYSYELKYPEGIIVPLIGQTFTLEDKNYTNAGTFHFVKNEDGTYSARIHFDEGYVSKAGNMIDGYLWFKGRLSEKKVDDKGDIVIAGQDKMTLTIPKKDIKYPSDETNKYNLKITKDGSYNRETGRLEYRVVVYSTKGTPESIDFSDVIKVTGMTLESPDVTVVKETWLNTSGYDRKDDSQASQTVAVQPNYDSNTGELTMQLPKLEVEPFENGIKYYKYVITYTYDVSKIDIGTLTADNKAQVKSKDSKTDTIIKNEDDNSISERNEYSISKNGQNEPENDRIKWTITLNEHKANIVGGTLTDDMLAKLKEGTDVLIDPKEGVNVVKDSNGNITSIKFVGVNGKTNTNKYTITYYTPTTSSWKKTEVVNTAKFQPSEGTEVGTTGKVTVGGGDVKKSLDHADISADGRTSTLKWTVSLIVPDGKLPKGTVIKDITTRSSNWENGKKNYLTVGQIKSWKGDFWWQNESGNNIYTGTFLDSQRFKVVFIKKDDWREYSYNDVIKMSDDTVFEGMNIMLLDELQCSGASQLNFSYSTTADLTDAALGNNKYYNTVEVDGKSASAAYNYTKAGIVKSAGNGQTDTTITTDDELTWKINVSTDDRDHDSLTVVDTLPDKVKLVGLQIEKRNGNYPKADFTINADGTFSGSGDFCKEFSIEESKYENNVITLVIKNKNGGKLPSELQYEITVKCEVENAQAIAPGTTYVFENEASAKEGEIDIGSSSQTQKWTKKDNTVVKKVVDKSGKWDQKHNKANYSIVLNPDEDDLVDGTEVLTLVDILSCYNKSYDASHLDENGNWAGELDHTKVTRVYAELDPNSIKLYYAVKDEQGNYKAGAEVTGWSWSYKSADGGNDWTNHILTISGIPDGKALVFEYGYTIERDAPDEYNNVQVLLKNTAELSGTIHKDSSEDQKEYWKEASAGGGVSTDKSYTLHKVDKDNYGKVLSGAVFELQEYKNGTYKKVDPETKFTTDSNGIVRVKWDSTVFKKNILYRLVEIQAPSGYKIPENAESDLQTIRFYFSDKNSTENVLPTEIPNGAIDLTKTSHTAYIENEVTETITLPETGGTGTYWYTMGGVLLTAGAAFLIYKKHMQKGGKRIW